MPETSEHEATTASRVRLARLLQQIDARLADWIAYRLGGGSQEHLDTILSVAGRSPGQRERRMKHALAASEASRREIFGPRLLDVATKARGDVARQGVATIDPREVCEGAHLEGLPAAFQLEKSFFFHLEGDLFRRAGEELGRLFEVSILRPQEVETLRIVREPAEEEQTEQAAPPAWHLDPQAVFDLLGTAEQASEDSLRLLLAWPGEVWEPGRPEVSGDRRRPDLAPFLPNRPPGAAIDVQKIVERLLSELNIPALLASFRVVEILGVSDAATTLRAEIIASRWKRHVVIRILPNSDCVLADLQLGAARRNLSDPEFPRILTLRDLEEYEEHVFLVVDFMEGRDAAKALEGSTPQQRVQSVIAIVSQVSEALAFAHSRGFSHGNIKATNILVSPDLKQALLGDFALPLALNGDTSRIPPFAVPRELTGQRSARADLYALGATIFRLLTGDYPAVEEGPEFDENLRQRHPHVPFWLGWLLGHCLAMAPGRGFADGVELVKHLHPFVNPGTPQTTLTATWEPGSSEIRYQLQRSAGPPHPQRLGAPLSSPLRNALFGLWEELGRLARNRHGETDLEYRQAIETQIHDELHRMRDAAGIVLGERVSKHLMEGVSPVMGCAAEPLLLRLGSGLEAIPWELLSLGNLPLCRLFPFARLPELHRAHRGRAPQGSKAIRVLLLADPTGSLAFARQECEALEKELRQSALGLSGRLEITLLGSEADSLRVRAAMRSCDILHFAGHGVCFPCDEDQTRNGWLIKGELSHLGEADVLDAAEMAQFWWQEAPPLLVFANGCASARVRLDATAADHHSDATRGLAPAILSAGASAYIGTAWDPPDNEATMEFALTYYRELVSGCSVAEALRSTRTAFAERDAGMDLTWARYLLFGDPRAHLKIR